jgi:hypothetical protein
MTAPDTSSELRQIQLLAGALAGSIASLYVVVLILDGLGMSPEVTAIPLGLPGFLALLGVVAALLAPGLIQRRAGFEEASDEAAMDRLKAEVVALFGVMDTLAVAVVLLSFLRGTMLWAHLFVPLALLVVLFQFPTRARVEKRRATSRPFA